MVLALVTVRIPVLSPAVRRLSPPYVLKGYCGVESELIARGVPDLVQLLVSDHRGTLLVPYQRGVVAIGGAVIAINVTATAKILGAFYFCGSKTTEEVLVKGVATAKLTWGQHLLRSYWWSPRCLLRL